MFKFYENESEKKFVIKRIYALNFNLFIYRITKNL